jgi:hypothetical protein
MALIDIAGREIGVKVVYYGPGLGGKTTNLRAIHDRLPAAAKNELQSIATVDERTLFFDFLPLDLGEVDGFTVRVHLATVPGQPRYERTRRTVLNAADGVVFVADAGRDRLLDNRLSLDELARNLTVQGKRLDAIPPFPLVLQYNKTDLPDAVPTAELDRALNALRVPRFEGVAISGVGVVETLRAIIQLVVRRL